MSSISAILPACSYELPSVLVLVACAASNAHSRIAMVCADSRTWVAAARGESVWHQRGGC